VDLLDPGPAGSVRPYKLVGGRLALDLVNTLSYPTQGPPHDWFEQASNITRWLEAVGLPSVTFDADEAEQVVALRGVVDDVVRPFAYGEAPAAPAVRRFNGVVVRSGRQRRIDESTLAWTWAAPVKALDALSPVVSDAAQIVTSRPPARIRSCPSCHWLFEDRSRNGMRRWCDMAECGNRAKARDYYRRRVDR
jgi:predicted RNA-binding Zn ribbon-like protein